MRVPKIALKRASTVTFQRLFVDINVEKWLRTIFECILFQPMRVAVGFSFLTKHPVENNISYMYAAQELAFAKARINKEVKNLILYFKVKD